MANGFRFLLDDWEVQNVLMVRTMNPRPGAKITVFDSRRLELGEGTFLEKSYMPELKMTVYECEEHTILAKGEHWLKVDGTLFHLREPSPNG